MMQRQVWKYYLDVSYDDQELMIPIDSKLVYVGETGRKIGLWFEVDINIKKERQRTFHVFGTGHDIIDGNHVGTVIMTPYVWHVYEITEGKNNGH